MNKGGFEPVEEENEFVHVEEAKPVKTRPTRPPDDSVGRRSKKAQEV